MSSKQARDVLFEKATRALASARLLLSDGDFEGACNRAYYAMFDAARGVLVSLGMETAGSPIKTHRGLISAFGEHVVKKHGAPSALGGAFNKVERLRLLADYTGEPINYKDATWALDQAEYFVAALQSLDFS